MYHVYIMTNQCHTVLYIGVTNHLIRRVYEHKNGLLPGFTKRYRVHKLVYYEAFTYMYDAISREKQLKRWVREKKNKLIETQNPTWDDLGEDWYA